MEQPKVIDKIDLSTIDSSTRPKKTAAKGAKKETSTKEVKGTQEEKENPVVPSPQEEIITPGPVKAEPAVITNIKASKML